MCGSCLLVAERCVRKFSARAPVETSCSRPLALSSRAWTRDGYVLPGSDTAGAAAPSSLPLFGAAVSTSGTNVNVVSPATRADNVVRPAERIFHRGILSRDEPIEGHRQTDLHHPARSCLLLVVGFRANTLAAAPRAAVIERRGLSAALPRPRRDVRKLGVSDWAQWTDSAFWKMPCRWSLSRM